MFSGKMTMSLGILILRAAHSLVTAVILQRFSAETGSRVGTSGVVVSGCIPTVGIVVFRRRCNLLIED